MINKNNIKNKSQELNEIIVGAKTIREKWQKGKKHFIKETLEEIVKETSLDCYVGINDEMINRETVYLTFGNKPSGIEYNSINAYNILEKKKGILTKYGGSLNFSLINNGQILIWRSCPYIEDVINSSPIKVVEAFKIDELDNNKIVLAVEEFLDEMIRWEKNEEERLPQIGFRVEQHTKEEVETLQ